MNARRAWRAAPLLAAMAAAMAQAPAADRWFTVSGDPQDPAADTVQVDPVAVSSQGSYKRMNLRVNRSQQRTNWDGIPYRSYDAQVLFDCKAGKADYLTAVFYLAPLWQGASHHQGDYVNSPKPMLFRDVEPNPTERIVRAACAAQRAR